MKIDVKFKCPYWVKSLVTVLCAVYMIAAFVTWDLAFFTTSIDYRASYACVSIFLFVVSLAAKYG